VAEAIFSRFAAAGCLSVGTSDLSRDRQAVQGEYPIEINALKEISFFLKTAVDFKTAQDL
jgi:hypothetical protein